MGYYANSNLWLSVPMDKVEDLRDELIAVHLSRGPKDDSASRYVDLTTGDLIVSLFNEDPGTDEEVLDDNLTIYGWGGGKEFADGSVYDIVAKYATGTIDWVEDNDPDGRWRIRFKDGGWKNYGGVVTVAYPDDPYDKEEN